jgi:hypothetical protein
MRDFGKSHGYTLFGLSRVSQKDNLIGPVGDIIAIPAIYEQRTMFYDVSIQERTCIDFIQIGADEALGSGRQEICVMRYFNLCLNNIYRVPSSSVMPLKNKFRGGNMLTRANPTNITQPIHKGISLLVAASLKTSPDKVYGGLKLFNREGYEIRQNKMIDNIIFESLETGTLRVRWKEQLIN